MNIKVRKYPNGIFLESDSINIGQIANSGQCFRINPYKLISGGYSCISKDKVCFVMQRPNGIVISAEQDDMGYWKHYFDVETDYTECISKIKQSNDMFLADAYNFGSGIRILNQDIWETLISFIISQRNTIPNIKTCVEKLSYKYGHPIGHGFYSFPTIKELSIATEDDLKQLSLGYRARFIYEVTQFFLDNDINEYFRYNIEDNLLNLLGVGDKVASCVLLFAFHKLDAFPIDTWIEQIIDDKYDGLFDDTLYEPYQGLVQQYMFYYYRYLNEKKRRW